MTSVAGLACMRFGLVCLTTIYVGRRRCASRNKRARASERIELATGRAHHISYRGEAAKAESNIGVPYIVAVATESLLHLLLVSRGP